MNLYIGNLPGDFDESELVELFEEYGQVKNAKIVRDHHTKISRGFGFVEMDTKDAGLKAIEDWNNGSIDGRVLQVKESRPKKKTFRRKA